MIYIQARHAYVIQLSSMRGNLEGHLQDKNLF